MSKAFSLGHAEIKGWKWSEEKPAADIEAILPLIYFLRTYLKTLSLLDKYLQQIIITLSGYWWLETVIKKGPKNQQQIINS